MFLMKRSLFTKILLSLLITTTIPFLVSSYYSYQIIGRSVKEQLVQLNQNAMAITMSSIHNYLHDISVLPFSYYSDQQLMRLLSQMEIQTPAESVYINKSIQSIYGSYPEIKQITFKSALTNKQFYIQSELNERIVIPDFEQNRLTSMQDVFDQEYAVIQVNGERRLQINRYLVDIASRDILGLTTLTVKNNTLKGLVDPLSNTEGSAVYIFLQNDLQMLYSSPGTSLENEWMERFYTGQGEQPDIVKGNINGTRGVYIYYREEAYRLPITLVKFIPQSVVDQAANQALNESISIQVVVIILVTIMAGVISYFFLFRVNRILRLIKNVKMGDFNIKKDAVVTDELGLLEERFQDMVKELDVLWNQQYRYQLEVSTARLKMLQAQINPHFLFNTLQSIGTLAIKKNASEVSDRLAELGAMFRYNMDIDTEEVQLAVELEHVNNYMSLQIGRFSKKLHFTQSCPEEANPILIPKMILQPLVENSIVHGMERGTGIGNVSIVIELRDYLHVEVIDNGRGFEPETIHEIRRLYTESFKSKQMQAGIGLINVLKRLQLYYGIGFEWQIESEPFVETVIRLLIPFDPMKEADRNESIDYR